MSGIDTIDDYEIHWADHEYRVEFVIYRITGRAKNPASGDFTVPLYGDQFQESRDGIPPFWTGQIKWDGCSEWDFMPDKDPGHLCGRTDALSIGRLMNRCFELATRMAKYDAIVAQ